MQQSWLRRPLLPTAVLLLGVLASGLLWRELRGSQVRELARLAESAAIDGRAAIAWRLDVQTAFVRDLASLLDRLGREAPGAWREDARILVDHLPEFDRMLWLEPDRPEVFVVARDRKAPRLEAAEHDALAPLLEQARSVATPRLLGPDAGPDGVRHYHLVERAREGKGILLATARLDATLAPILRIFTGRMDTRVLWDGREVFRLGEEADSQPEVAREAERSARIALPGGGIWELRVAPSPALVQAVESPAPHFALALGVLTSGLLAVLLVAYRGLRQRSELLASSHRELDVEAARAREAERAALRLAGELEHRVEARTQQLADAVDELEAFNYSVSHDLRSPLGAILNLSVVLAEDHGEALGREGLDVLARVRHSARTALAMMDGLLDLSRLARAPFALERVDMEALARDSFAEARSSLDAGEVGFELAALPEACADPSLMRLVWTNLLRNAIKYSRHREKPHVAVFGTRQDGDLVYTVRDNGAGFDARLAEKLFRPFQRLHSNAEFEGSGIGLAVVARAVRRHGGRIWAEGEVGVGACFSFSLPTTPTRGAREA